MTKEKKLSVWMTWLLVWPSVIYLLYVFFTPGFQGVATDIFSFALLMCVVAFFPLVFGDYPIFFTHGVSLAVFLYFGLFIELILTQIALVVFIIKLRIPRQDLYRLPLNMLMFMAASCASAFVYKLLGGKHGSASFEGFTDIIPVLGYILTLFLVNQILIIIFGVILHNRPVKILDRSMLWEISTTILVMPVGFLLYLLYSQIGVVAVYFVGIPFVFITVMLMLYHSSQQVNVYLQKISDIGHELTGQLNVTEVIDLFINRIVKLLPLRYCYIYNVIGDKLELIRFHDARQIHTNPLIKLSKGESISGTVLETGKGIQFNSRRQWSHLVGRYLPDDGESVISLPVYRSSEIVAVITIISSKKRAFEKYQYMILGILANYLAVAIENARNYEDTKIKSERCPLTRLYNYRYFEEELKKTFDWHVTKKESISLILLDLDHFKQVNDTYGHESGNEVLRCLAEKLTRIVSDRGTVARYGGEEFVIMLPGLSAEEGIGIAEFIRKEIASKPVKLNKHILNENEDVSIWLTASIGVAAYPDHCENHEELIRHADRAMYTGAKQKGRNKVASYMPNIVAAE